MAAATARAAAAGGERTLLLSAEPAERLGPVLGVPTDAASAPSGSVPCAAATPPASPPSCAAGAERVLSTASARAPVQLDRNLWAARMDAGAEFRESLLAAQKHAEGALGLLGAAPLEEDELLQLPGAEELALLRALRAVCREPAARRGEEAVHSGHLDAPPAAGGGQQGHGGNGRSEPYGSGAADPADHTSGRGRPARSAEPWDTVVVDMPALPHAPSALALPEALRRYLRRLVPPERQAARALRPLLAQLAQVPVPGERLYEVTRRIERELAAVQEVVRSARTTVRLVVEPGPLAVEALRTAQVGCALYGLPVEAVVANRLLPDGSSDPWLSGASRQQRMALEELCDHSVRRGTPVYGLPHLGRDPCGASDLAELGVPATVSPDGAFAGAESADSPPAAASPGAGALRVEDRLADEGQLLWRLALPGVRRAELDVVRRADELIVTAGPYRRVVELPSALRRCRIASAALDEGELVLRFVPDGKLWPQPS